MTKKQTSRKPSAKKPIKRPAQKPRFIKGFLIAMAFFGGIAGWSSAQIQPSPEVLAYATNMSVNGLLSGTNSERAAAGLPALKLNSKLNSAAVGKANDMIVDDYWAHTAPDGTQPWAFILAAGYSYQTAGENLAYGALTSAQTVQAWMNSPGHRANILNSSFTEVGFGFLNASNYQSSGQQTVVVAMYASPYAPAPPPPPKPKPAPATTTLDSNSSVPSAPSAPSPAPTASKPDEKPKSDEPADKEAAPKAEVDQQAKDAAPSTENQTDGQVPEQPDAIKRVEVLSGLYSPWLVASVAVAGTGAGGTFLYRHSRRWHRLIIKGEKFIAHHVLLDIIVLAVGIAAIILLQTVGRIL